MFLNFFAIHCCHLHFFRSSMRCKNEFNWLKREWKCICHCHNTNSLRYCILQSPLLFDHRNFQILQLTYDQQNLNSNSYYSSQCRIFNALMINFSYFVLAFSCFDDVHENWTFRGILQPYGAMPKSYFLVWRLLIESGCLYRRKQNWSCEL